jgi:hypothetical protein
MSEFDIIEVPKMSNRRRDVIQTRNPKSGRYVKIDRDAGRIISHKKSEGPYANVPIARKRSQ